MSWFDFSGFVESAKIEPFVRRTESGRADLAGAEREEIAIISGYLPKQMSEDDVKAAIAATVADSGANGIKDMGKVIGALKAKYAGQMDFGKASALVKAALTG